MAKKLTKLKAMTILHEGMIRGMPLTKKQRGYFGVIAGGGRPTRVKKKKK